MSGLWSMFWYKSFRKFFRKIAIFRNFDHWSEILSMSAGRPISQGVCPPLPHIPPRGLACDYTWPAVISVVRVQVMKVQGIADMGGGIQRHADGRRGWMAGSGGWDAVRGFTLVWEFWLGQGSVPPPPGLAVWHPVTRTARMAMAQTTPNTAGEPRHQSWYVPECGWCLQQKQTWGVRLRKAPGMDSRVQWFSRLDEIHQQKDAK